VSTGVRKNGTDMIDMTMSEQDDRGVNRVVKGRGGTQVQDYFWTILWMFVCQDNRRSNACFGPTVDYSKVAGRKRHRMLVGNNNGANNIIVSKFQIENQ